MCIWESKFSNILSEIKKKLNQAEIVKKSVILLWLLNMTLDMTIWCKRIYRLELQKFF